MKRIALRLAVAILTLVLGVAAFFTLNRVRQQAGRERIKAEAIRLTNEFHEAVFNGDTLALNNLLAEDFTGVGHTNMGIFTVSRAEQIAAAEAGKEAQVAAGEAIPSIVLTDVKVHDEGSKIVVEAVAIAQRGGERDSHHPRHVTYTFTGRQGHLKLSSAETK